MAWQRTIPFGYQMRQGKIETNATEADTVKDVFARYLQGKSFQRIAETMTARGVRYHQHTDCWSKNMVKRILENGHYLGDELYPRVIDDEDFLAVQMLKAGRTTHAPCKVSAEIRKKTACGRCGAKLIRTAKNRKTARWECESSDCGHTVLISDEQLNATVDALLETLAHTPEALMPRIPAEAVRSSNAAQRIANELTNALNRGTESVDYLRSLIFACAAERYNEQPDTTPQYKLDKLRERLENGETLRQELLKTAVRSIRITDGDAITLELVNDQIITKEAADV